MDTTRRKATSAILAAALIAATAGASDWPSYRRDANNSGSIAVSRSPAATHLARRWTYNADSTITSTPTESNGLVYVGTWNGGVVALSAADGAVRWKAHLRANPDEVYGGPRGVLGSIAIAEGVAYASSGGCEAAAFDAQTGKELWRRTICDVAKNDDVYASPVVAGGLVLVGVGILADRPTDRGREIALDARTGETRWSIEPALYHGSGAGVSSTPAVDADKRIAYVGTGNPTPMNAPPPGDDPGSDSILAIDMRSGRTLWTFGPIHPHDTQDDDLFASPNRFNAGTRAKPRWVIGEGGKDGTYYAVDATDGKPLWRRTLAPASPSAMIVGTAAVSNGAVFVPLYNGGSGSLTALRASDGAILWQAATGGEYEAPAVRGSIVFTTETSGWLDAFKAGDGKIAGRWRLCGSAKGRGPAADADGVIVAAGRCLTYYDAE